MSTNPNKAGLASALDKGMQGLTQGIEGRPAARLAKAKAEQSLDTVNYQNETDQLKNEIDNVNAKLKENTAIVKRESTFRALKYYSTDGNPRHLNNLLKQDEMMQASGIIRFNKLDLTNDKQLINTSGMLDEADLTGSLGMEDIVDNTRYVKATMKDGTEKIIDTYQVKQMSGYFQNLNDKEIEQELAANEAKGKSKSGYAPGEWEKKANLVASEGVDTKKNAVKSLYNDMKTGNVSGQLQEAEAAEQKLDKEFGGSFATNFDPTDQTQRAMAEPTIERIEAMRGIKWSASEMKDLNDISILIGLGSPGSQLTDEETGFWDNTLFNVKKYFSDEGGSGANEAYAAYRNSLRNALYGSALTEFEIAAFNEQLGSLKMQRGPLIQQMITSMNQVQAKLENIYNMNNSYASTYRLGINRSKLANIIGALEQNKQRIQDLASGKAIGKSKEQRINDIKGQL